MLRTAGAAALAAVAALVDDDQHHVLGVGVRAEGHEPRVRLEARVRWRPCRSCRRGYELSEAGEALEGCRRRCRSGRDHALEALRGWPCSRSASMVTWPVTFGANLLDHLARRGSTTSAATCGLVAGAPVGEGGVGHGLLDRGQHGRALAEGHLDVVAACTRWPLGKRLGVPRRAASAASGWLSTRPCASSGRSIPVIVALAVRGGLVLDRRRCP